jgi:hypothetical protein
VDNRLHYLLTLFPPLPSPDEPLPVTLAEVVRHLRQQGGGDLAVLADLLEADAVLREALEEWIVNEAPLRSPPEGLPPRLESLFDNQLRESLGELAWVEAVLGAYGDLRREVGERLGSDLFWLWVSYDETLRRQLALHRARLGATGKAPDQEAPAPYGVRHEALVAADEWTASLERAKGGGESLDDVLEAEMALDRARLAFLEKETPRYAFTLDELVAYLLRLQVLERYQRLDPERGRALLKEVATL